MDCFLLQEFKYWTFRFVLTPDHFREETKRLMDVNSNSPCDTYHSITYDEQQIIAENMLRFFEILNKIKRTALRKSRGRADAGGRERLESKAKMRCSGNISKTKFESGGKGDENFAKCNEDDEELKEENEIRVSRSMNLTEIVAVMRDPSNGVPCIGTHNCLPTSTFISADAATWLLKYMDGIDNKTEAIEFLQHLLNENIIRHISKKETKVIHGFYLYYFVIENDNSDKAASDAIALGKDWYEVEIELCDDSKKPTNHNVGITSLTNQILPTFLLPDICLADHKTQNKNRINKGDMYRDGYLDVDSNKKSDRYEWGHLRYQTKYSPLSCYELELRWMCATGNIIFELLQMWQRRATNLNLHLFPIPSHPFALPFSSNSNPLRGPIVIPLKIEVLKDENGMKAFSEFSESTRRTRIHLFQESILSKFGFMNYPKEDDLTLARLFVHVTGNIIVHIVHNHEEERKKQQQSKAKRKFKNSKTNATSVNLFTESVNPHYPEPCFLMTFNYTMTKRWKSSSSGDEALAERILMDFKDFCSDGSQRLRNYWDLFKVSYQEPTPLSSSSSESDVFLR